MKRSTNFVVSICLLLALAAPTGVPASARAAGPGGTQAEWQRVSPGGEEFSILTPVAPVMIRLGAFQFEPGGEKVLERRSYGGHDGDFIFFIESYKAARPQKLAKHLGQRDYPRRVSEGEVQLSGFKAKQYRLEGPNFYGKYFLVLTKEHAYSIMLASREQNSAAVTRFVSSLILGDKITEPATGRVVDVRDTAEYRDAVAGKVDSGPVAGALSPKAVDRKATIVARPEPIYTELARQNGLTGTVVLRGVFASDGQLRSLRVLRGLEGGLTEKAVEAALCISFFPAEKDGKPVSQYIQIEYNFNLY